MLVKDYQEVVPVQFDFTAALLSDTIVSSVVSISVIKGQDLSAQSVLQSASTIGGGIVTQWLAAGVVGVIYHIRCKVLLSSNRILVAATDLSIQG